MTSLLYPSHALHCMVIRLVCTRQSWRNGNDEDFFVGITFHLASHQNVLGMAHTTPVDVVISLLKARNHQCFTRAQRNTLQELACVNLRQLHNTTTTTTTATTNTTTAAETS